MAEQNRHAVRISAELAGQLKTDRRRDLRHTITLPVRVSGTDRHNHQWSESTESVNVSSGGVALRLSKEVMIGDIVYVEIPLPARFQKNVEPSPTHNTYACVRYIFIQGSQRIVRLQFVREP